MQWMAKGTCATSFDARMELGEGADLTRALLYGFIHDCKPKPKLAGANDQGDLLERSRLFVSGDPVNTRRVKLGSRRRALRERTSG